MRQNKWSNSATTPSWDIASHRRGHIYTHISEQPSIVVACICLQIGKTGEIRTDAKNKKTALGLGFYWVT